LQSLAFEECTTDETIDSFYQENFSAQNKKKLNKNRKASLDIDIQVESDSEFEKYENNQIAKYDEENEIEEFDEILKKNRIDLLSRDYYTQKELRNHYGPLKCIKKQKRGEIIKLKVNNSAFEKCDKEKLLQKKIEEFERSARVRDSPNTQEIINKFKEVSINLNICSTPWEFNNRIARDTKSFLLDLVRERDITKFSYINMFIGENFVRVVDIDTELSQLVLLVKEPQTTIKFTRRERDLKSGKMKTVEEIQNVPEAQRNILIGKDEGHLFIALLPEKVNNVQEAHECLKPFELRRNKKLEYIRQGEWFFLKSNDTYYKNAIRKRDGMTNGIGRKHKVSELLDLQDKEDYINKNGETEYLIRGYVSHPEHQNKYFKSWMRAIANTEKPLPEIKGVTWID
jgi:hypothetical protein